MLGAIMIVLTTAVNMVGVRIMLQINNIGVLAEIIGAAGLIILLASSTSSMGPSVLFETDGTGAGHDWGYFGALLIGAIMPLYVMYGFDTAGSLAEETDGPAAHGARAPSCRALATAGIMGFLLIGFGDDGGRTRTTAVHSGLAGDHDGRARRHLGQGLAVGRRARDLRLLPRDPGDEHPHPVRDGPRRQPAVRAGDRERLGTRRVPVVPALASGAIALLILAFNIVNPSAFTIIISLGIILMYLAYLGVTIPLLRKRSRAGRAICRTPKRACSRSASGP